MFVSKRTFLNVDIHFSWRLVITERSLREKRDKRICGPTPAWKKDEQISKLIVPIQKVFLQKDEHNREREIISLNISTEDDTKSDASLELPVENLMDKDSCDVDTNDGKQNAGFSIHYPTYVPSYASESKDSFKGTLHLSIFWNFILWLEHGFNIYAFYRFRKWKGEI